MVNHSMQTTDTGHSRTAAGAIHVAALSGESTCRARAAAAKLESVICDCGEFTGPHLVIGETEAWLEMDGRQVRIAFDSATMLHRRRGGQNELLGRAVGVKAGLKPVVWDATGGLGRDAFVLADLGCRVMLCERVSACLLYTSPSPRD